MVARQAAAVALVFFAILGMAAADPAAATGGDTTAAAAAPDSSIGTVNGGDTGAAPLSGPAAFENGSPSPTPNKAAGPPLGVSAIAATFAASATVVGSFYFL